MTTSPLIERPRPATRGPGDQPGNQQASAAARIDRTPAPAERAALAVLLVGTAALYLWGLGASGWANSFYSAAAQAGSESWKAFFFGSSDAANSITVDKTPLALWPMALSVRVFGLSSWSILVPQALDGRGRGRRCCTPRCARTTGSAAPACSPGAVLALTPVAVLMFRFNNPDALLVAAARRLRRTPPCARVEAASGPAPVRWLALAGALVGLAFLTKMLQAFLVLPALGAGLPAVRAAIPLAPADRSPARRLRRDARSPPAGGSRSSSLWPAVEPALHRRLPGQLASSSSPSATTASAG